MNWKKYQKQAIVSGMFSEQLMCQQIEVDKFRVKGVLLGEVYNNPSGY